MMLVFALAAPAMATAGVYTASYEQNASGSYPDFSSTGSGTIYLTIMSNKVGNNYIARYNLPISITAEDHDEDGNPDYCTAYEALLAADADNTNYPELSLRWGYYNNLPTGASYALTGVKDTTVSSDYLGISLDPIELGKIGYMFRIDDEFPILNSTNWPNNWSESTYGPCGAALEQAYITDGQYLTVYFADAKAQSEATNYLKIDGYQYLSSYNYLMLCVTGSTSYYGPAYTYKWYINDFAPLSSSAIPTLSVKVNGTTKTAYYYTATQEYSVYIVTNVANLLSENTVEIVPDFTTRYGKDSSNNPIAYQAMIYTGAYGVFPG